MGLQLLALIPAIMTGFGAIKDLVLRFFPDKIEQAKVLAEIKKIEDEVNEKVREHTEVVQQLEINLEEAKSEKWWKAGWRPGLAWVCVAAWFFELIIVPIANSILTIEYSSKNLLMGIPPDKLDIVLWLTAGLAGLRQFSKTKWGK